MTFARCLALYVTSIVGVGVLGLPALAYRQAGVWSLVAWLVMIVLGAAVGYFFLQLALHHASGGGVADYARAAFGDPLGRLCGYLFYFAIPFGAPATAHIAALMLGEYQSWQYWTAFGIILVGAVIANAAGTTVAFRVQLVGAVVLAVALAVAVGGAITHVEPANFTTGPEHGPLSALGALLIVFFAFAGWEAVTGFAHEALTAGVNLRRVTAITVAIIAVLYTGFAVTSIGAIGPDLATTPNALGTLLSTTFGPHAVWVSRALSLLLGLLAVNAFVGSVARLGADLTRRRHLPQPLARATVRTHSLQLGILGAVVTAVFAPTALGMDTTVEIASGMFAAVTIIGLLAAARLLTLSKPALLVLFVTCALFASAILSNLAAIVTITAVAAATVVFVRNRAGST
ncbi:MULTISPECIES: APC family permease [Prauserella salsuginis group]|uniref:APC family permease n=1 Tax=Prauserella salsuginis TaxID=387889 RepID=A0ABW6G073_9PSEU|nr:MULTISPECIES: amino acid permease [Prauserella salsuginis group]MCR3721202.1 amino acid efflux transporter [Prauserella flava]MCR3734717.1 amino acid efflux transporter [Prauserella salsuginis]